MLEKEKRTMATSPLEHVWIVYVVHDGMRTAMHAFRDESRARQWADSRAQTAQSLNSIITIEPLTIK